MSLFINRSELPRPPVDIADEVELWARQYGRHAKLEYIPVIFHGGRVLRGAWVVMLSLRSDDKRMQLYQQGLAPEPPVERIWLHRPNPKAGQPIGETGGKLKEPPYLGLSLSELGASGVRQFLEKGDTWSGRGEFASLEDYVRKTQEANEAERLKFRADQKEANRFEQRETRRRRFKIPFIPVSIGWKAHRERTP